MIALERLKNLDREARLVARIASALGWDQETYMPPAAIEERGDQLAFLETLAHAKRSSPEIGELLDKLGSTPGNPGGDDTLPEMDRAYLRVMRRAYDQATRLPSELVSELAKATSLSQAAWAKARAQNDYASFAPFLDTMLGLTRSVASCLDHTRKPYDVLLDRYEEGASYESVNAVFTPLKAELGVLMDKIASRPQVDDAVLHRQCPEAAQARASGHIMDILSYDRDQIGRAHV